MNSNDSDAEAYLLLLLSDGNLPTGSFVASSGLESLFAHALAIPSSSSSHQPAGSKSHDPLLTITSSIRDSLSSYARSAIPFVRDTHRVVEDYASSSSSSPTSPSTDDVLNQALNSLLQLDALYECTTLNHVARRASSTQGVALLTLYSKGFSVPAFLSTSHHPASADTINGVEPSECSREKRDARMIKLVDRLKFLVRRGDTPGHLPICWGVLAGALGLSIGAFVRSSCHYLSIACACARLPVLLCFFLLRPPVPVHTSTHATANLPSSCTSPPPHHTDPTYTPQPIHPSLNPSRPHNPPPPLPPRPRSPLRLHPHERPRPLRSPTTPLTCRSTAR